MATKKTTQQRTEGQEGAKQSVEAIKNMAASRTKPSRAAKDESTHLAHQLLEPDSEPVSESQQQAELLVQRQMVANAKQAEAERREDDDKYQYFLKCASCGRPAIFFTSNPIGRMVHSAKSLLEDDDRVAWYTTYKPIERPYAQREIKCQCCHKEGRTGSVRMNLRSYDENGPVFDNGGKFLRFVYKVGKTKEQFEADKEQELRASRTGSTVMDNPQEVKIDG